MTIRVYLMPRIGTGGTTQDSRRPKYQSLVAGLPTSVIDYGPEPYCIFIVDVDPTAHSNVMANADVRALPADLDTTVTAGQQTTIVNTLEAVGIPAQWVAVGMTYRVVLRRLAGIFQLLHNVRGRGFRFLQAALSDPISALPANVRQAMSEAAAFYGLDTTGITGSTTLRAALTSIGNQFAARPVVCLGVSL